MLQHARLEGTGGEMDLVCVNCGHCTYDASYVLPYQCRQDRPFQRMGRDFAEKYSCAEWTQEKKQEVRKHDDM